MVVWLSSEGVGRFCGVFWHSGGCLGDGSSVMVIWVAYCDGCFRVGSDRVMVCRLQQWEDKR